MSTTPLSKPFLPFAASVFCLSLALCGPVTAQSDFTKMPGTAHAIGVGANGALWVIGTGRSGNDYNNIFRWGGTQWQLVNGAGLKIAVDPAGNAVVVNSVGKIFRYSTASSPPWQEFPSGVASDVAVGANGDLWMVGSSQPPVPDQPIWHWTNQAWERAPGAAVQIAVAPDGAPWVVNAENILYERNLLDRTWIQHPVKVRAIAIGARGDKFAVSNTAAGGGNYEIWQETGGLWVRRSIAGVAVAVGPAGEPYVLTASNEIYRGTPLPPSTTIILDAPLEVSDLAPEPGTISLFMTPAPLPAWSRGLVPFTGGKMVCSGSACGTTKADYVGQYQLDVTCDTGTYSPLYGGSCWTCPVDDGLGNPWVINLVALEGDEGCWRVPYLRYGKATWIKLGWAWDCDSSKGEFWDTNDANGNFVFGGSCWKCADPQFPNRSVYPIAGNMACVTPLNETNPAKLLSFNGCPQPDAAAMKLPGQRQPDKPFLDIAAGWSQGVASGGCYSCPSIAENGDVLITARNLNSIADRANNSGCDIKFRWTLPAFPEPGLSGLDGVKDVLFENNTLLRPSDVSYFLRLVATARNMTDDQADTYVAAEWKKIADNPYTSELRTVLYGYLRNGLLKKDTDRTAGEKKLIASFENYIRIRRTFLAQQALNMYDAWKQWSDAQASTYASPLEKLFYYGTVPLDFHEALTTFITMTATSAGIAGNVAALEVFASTLQFAEKTVTVATNQTAYDVSAMDPVKRQIFLRGRPATPAAQAAKAQDFKSVLKVESRAFNYLENVKILLNGTKGANALLGGAAVIELVGVVLESVAIDQFMAIITARPKLEAALAAADQPVSLAEFVAQPNGEDITASYWSKAMEGGLDISVPAQLAQTDSQILQMAKSAYVLAQAKNFWP